MTTVVDELVLQFGLDPDKFSRGQKEALGQLRNFELAAVKTGTEVERQQAKINDVFGAFRREAIGALGLLLGGRGIKEFVGYVTNLDAQTGRLAKTMDMSARELAAWQGAAKVAGGTGEAMTGTLQGITQDMNRFMLIGQGTLQQVLRPLGISLFDANGQLKTAGELLLELSSAAEHMDPARFAAFFSMIPGANQDSLNVIIQGRRAVEDMLEAQRRINTISPESIKLAQDYQAALGRLDTAATSFGRSLLVYVEPALTKTADAFQRLLTKGLEPRIGKGSFMDMMTSDKRYDLSRAGMADLWGDLKQAWNYDPALDDARHRLAEGLSARTAGGSASPNWSNFLSGLSYLETSHKNVGNANSSARGYFQFLTGTADKATAAGLPDPREGDYGDQAAATRRYIERFYPGAAAAIEKGDYAAAERMLKGEWPSLPGGSQQQTAARYDEYRRELAGGGSSRQVTIGQVVVNTQATDAKGIARDIKPAIEGTAFASQFNGGQQ